MTTQPVICPSCQKPNSVSVSLCQYCGSDLILNNDGPRYWLTRVLKEGGQGAVYEGRGEDGTIYAVKEMLDRFTEPRERDEAAVRFAAEAATLGRLVHPRIPRVYASFNDEGRHYLVLDFIRGEDLDEIVTREGAQPEARVLAWADELCDVLGYLHAQGVIYRDMKPANVMVEQSGGMLKLIDFGIAKVFQVQARGTQIGTPGYAPPEQYQGLATRASDIYALGATLHHLLSGRNPQDEPPFSYPPLRTLVPTISARTEAAVARATQMRQEDRFQSIAELRAALLPTPVRQVTPPRVAAASVTRPAAPAVPVTNARAARTMPALSPAAIAVPASSPRRRGGVVALVVLLLLIIGGAGFAVLRLGLLPSPPVAATVTAQVLVAQPFVAPGIELGVALGSDATALDQAFAAEFLRLARGDCACEPQIQSGSLHYLVAPVELSTDATGTRYRASLEGMLLVPQR